MAGKTGKVIWFDLTVPDAANVRDFYEQVVGWKPDAVPVDDYHDYNMLTDDGVPAVGICHKRGSNAALPSQWMIYITVDNLDASLAACEANGGKVVVPVREMGGSRMVVIEDPAGAVCTLFEQGETPAE